MCGRSILIRGRGGWRDEAGILRNRTLTCGEEGADAVVGDVGWGDGLPHRALARAPAVDVDDEDVADGADGGVERWAGAARGGRGCAQREAIGVAAAFERADAAQRDALAVVVGVGLHACDAGEEDAVGFVPETDLGVVAPLGVFGVARGLPGGGAGGVGFVALALRLRRRRHRHARLRAVGGEKRACGGESDKPGFHGLMYAES